MTAALLALALAVLIWPVRPKSRARLNRPKPGRARTLPVPARPRPADPLALAAAFDLLAACLKAGLTIPASLVLAAEDLPGHQARPLTEVARSLGLGASPGEAWASADSEPSLRRLARAARQTARSGTALADTASGLAAQLRTTTEHEAEAKAQRVAVLSTAPLGLCFLPAFLCLGILPTVLGLTNTLIHP